MAKLEPDFYENVAAHGQKYHRLMIPRAGNLIWLEPAFSGMAFMDKCLCSSSCSHTHKQIQATHSECNAIYLAACKNRSSYSDGAAT